jgi:hypothetical protein
MVSFQEMQNNIEDRFHEEINCLREENNILKEELEDIKLNYQ